MRDREARLIDLARAVSDGGAIDWSAAESMAATDSERLQIRHMRVVHELASESFGTIQPSVHQSLLHPDEAVAATDGQAPVVWGPLRVIEKIGRGRFGDVYRAWDPRLDREVALKLLRHRPAARDDLGSSVIEEGRLLARVRHPNIVIVHGAERINDRVGVWMELVRGTNLQEVLDARGPLPAADVIAIGRQLLQALGAVHRAGLVHRDVKAQNVMRDHDGRLVLMDFGTGREVDADAAPELAGTPLYLAPEVLDGAPATPRSDLYSLGVLLYLLAAGQHPVRGRSLAEIRRAHESGRPRPVREAAPQLPASLADAIDKLIAARPDDRFQSAADAEAALEAPASLPRSRAGRRVAGVAAVLVVAVSIWLWISPDTPGGDPVDARAPQSDSLAPPLASAPSTQPLPGPPAVETPAPALTSTVTPVPTPVEAADRWHQLVSPPCIGPVQSWGMVCSEWPIRLQQQGRPPPAPLVSFHFDRRPHTTVVQLVGPEQIGSAVPSPDGRIAAFVVLTVGLPVEIRTVQLSQRDVRRVTQLPNTFRSAQLLGWASHDGKLETLMTRSDRTAVLALIDPDSGHIETVFEFESGPQTVARSADGRIVFDVDQRDGSSKRDLRICQLGSGICEPLAAHPGNDGMPQWLPDGRLLFVSDRFAAGGIWRIDPDDRAREAELLKTFGNAVVRLWGNSGAGVVALEVRPRAVDVYQSELGTGSPMAPMIRLSRGSVAQSRSPAWSRQSSALAYLRRGAVVIQSLNPLTTTTISLDFDFETSRLAWSPDGRVLAVRSRAFDTGSRSTPPAVRLIGVASQRTIATLERPAQETDDPFVDGLAWLDDRRLMMALPRRVVSLDRDTGLERPLWQAPADQRIEGVSVSPNRSSLAVVVAGPASTSRLLHVALADGTVRELLSVTEPNGIRVADWMPDGQSVLAVRFVRPSLATEPRGVLWRVPVDGRAPVQTGLEAGALAQVTVQPDGRTLTFVAGNAEPELWLWMRSDFLPPRVAGRSIGPLPATPYRQTISRR